MRTGVPAPAETMPPAVRRNSPEPIPGEVGKRLSTTIVRLLLTVPLAVTWLVLSMEIFCPAMSKRLPVGKGVE